MSFKVSRALEMAIFQKCRLLTGQEGLNNEISWVNILEILDDLSHIEPGEFLITTGHDLHNQGENKQHRMVEFFAARNLAAVAIQTGHYVKEIPPSFIRFCEEYNIPLIEIPPDISFKTLTWSLMNELIKSTHAKTEVAITIDVEERLEMQALDIKKIWQQLMEEEKPESIHFDLEKYGISLQKPIIVIALSIHREQNAAADLPGEIKTELFGQAEQKAAQLLIQMHIPFLMAPSGHYIALMIQPDQLKERKCGSDAPITRRLLEEMELLFPGCSLKIGCSSLRDSINELKQAVDEAEKALQAAQVNLINNWSIVSYTELGIYRLLADIKHIETLKELYNKTTAPLINYDQSGSGALIQTLKTYLQTGSIKNAADEMFIRRHTMKYRLELIKRLTGYDPLLPGDALQLNVGLHIYRYLDAFNLLS